MTVTSCEEHVVNGCASSPVRRDSPPDLQWARSSSSELVDYAIETNLRRLSSSSRIRGSFMSITREFRHRDPLLSLRRNCCSPQWPPHSSPCFRIHKNRYRFGSSAVRKLGSVCWFHLEGSSESKPRFNQKMSQIILGILSCFHSSSMY